MFYIHLMRIKCETLAQANFLTSVRDPVTVIEQSFQIKPTALVRNGSEWHIGNVELLSNGGVAFAMGRTQAVKSPLFDIDNHDFKEEEALKAPFTIGVFDKETQACGIIRKSGVSQNGYEVAKKLEVLLNSSGLAAETNTQILVETIPDPVGFIEAIFSAKFVKRFSFTVTRPNPHDIDRLIQGPAEEFTEAANGLRTKIEVEGPDLSKELIQDVAHAVAAVGEEATASIVTQAGRRSKRVHLSGNAVVEAVDPDARDSVLNSILNRTREAYYRVRNGMQIP